MALNYNIKVKTANKSFIKETYRFSPETNKSEKTVTFENINDEQFKRLRKICKRYNLSYEITNNDYKRGSSYRRTFFNCSKPILNHYFCAYCGKFIPKKDITVDHIFPVHCAEKNIKAQKRLNSLGIKNINSEKNLAPACKSCNSIKGAKTGLWIPKGYLGRIQYLWIFRHMFRYSVLNIIIFVILKQVI